MSEKQEEEEKSKLKDNNKNDNDDIPKQKSTEKDNTNKDQNKKDNERTVEEIEKELDELRPKPPSPKSKHRIEEEEKINDRHVAERKQHKESCVPIQAKSNKEDDNNQQHNANELTPGQPDPTVNDNVKIPVLNDHGDVELKPQKGSAFNKNHQTTEENKNEKE